MTNGRSTGLFGFRQLAVLAACLLLAAPALGQRPVPTPQTGRESTMTLAQIVERQRESYGRIRNATGEAVWREEIVTTDGAIQRNSRVVYFVVDGDDSLTLIQGWDERPPLPSRTAPLDWKGVLSAAIVTSDTVFMVGLPDGGTTPAVMALPYNPAVHENNPLVAFHPRILGDERVRLSALSATAGEMAHPPRVTEFIANGFPLLRIEFSNPAYPRDLIYYIVNPARGYLTEEIGVINSGRQRVRTQIVVGHTKDGTWVPARRHRQEFDPNGRLVSRETWYYWSLAVNEGIPRRGISFDVFHLPPDVTILRPGRPQRPPAGATTDTRPR